MSASTIVFSQKELLHAIECGFNDIILCDGIFNVPLAGGIVYTAVGVVKISAEGSENDFKNSGVVFSNFIPDFKKAAKSPYKFVNVPHKGSSFSSSYKLGSFASSYRLSSSYRIGGSFVSSYSYASSYRLKTSYRIGGSFVSSYIAKAVSSFTHRNSSRTEIFVNGYGIHLI